MLTCIMNCPNGPKGQYNVFLNEINPCEDTNVMTDDKKIKSELVTIMDYIRWASSQFNRAELTYGHGTENALDEAVALVSHALAIPHDVPAPMYQARLTDEEKSAVIELINKRINKRIPLPYLTNEAWFAGIPFYVDERVLVPRSPLAELIEQHFEPWLDLTNTPDSRFLDLCTGSACIAIACAMAFPESHVDAVDISRDALDVARINVKKYALEQQVSVIESDLFSALPEKRYNIIISNPPYVDETDMANLTEEFKHEPALGLEAGKQGLDIVTRILEKAANFLLPGGLLIVEVGNSAPALEQALPHIDFTWLEFERGGQGVFLLSYEQLMQLTE